MNFIYRTKTKKPTRDLGSHIGEIYEHNKTKTRYEVTGFCLIRSTVLHLTTYRSLRDGIVWMRPTSEFFDGRFKNQNRS